jgi:Protein of unknown function (DUF1360)
VPDETERPPYEAYAAIVAAFFGGLGAVSAAERSGRPLRALDLVVLGAATFKASRTLSRERVASFLRQPFVEGDASHGEDERPAGTGLQRAIGELVTCTRCIGTWTAAGLASSQVVAPRFGRLLTWSLAASAANDFLQAGFAAICARVNELERAEAQGTAPAARPSRGTPR